MAVFRVRSVCDAAHDRTEEEDRYTHTHTHTRPGLLAQTDRRTLDFKVATPVHRSLSKNSASHIADDFRLVADARERRLRSTESRTCVVTRTHSTFGDRAFAAAGPGLWNSLPPHLRDVDLPYSWFRRSLKTFLFG